jgi:hypothetical protein
MKVSEFEVQMLGDEAFANLMGAMSILSNVQEKLEALVAHSQLSVKEPTDMINHAKEHVIAAMELIHKEKELPGQLCISGPGSDKREK